LGFVEEYVRYHKLSTDASTDFANLLAVQILGHQLGRNSVHLIQPDLVHLNMYLALVGQSSTSRKTTAQNLAKKIYPYHKQHHEDIGSPEQFIAELADHPNYFMWYGEWSYMLKAITTGGYMSRIAEILNVMFDCPNSYTRTLRKSKHGESEFVIEEPYLSLNTSVTEEVLLKFVNEEMIHGGFFARFLIIKGKSSPKPRHKLPIEASILKKKLTDVLRIVGDLGENSKTYFEFSDEATERFNEIEMELYKIDGIKSFIGRYTNYLIAIADILYISDLLGKYLPTNDSEYIGQLSKLTKLTSLSQLTNISTYMRDNRDTFDKVQGVIFARKRVNDDNHHIDPLVKAKWEKDEEKTIKKERMINKSENNHLEKKSMINKKGKKSPIIIEKKYVNRAYKLILPCINYVKELSNYTDVVFPVTKLERFMKKNPIVDHSNAMRKTHLNSKDMELARTTLVEQGVLECELDTKVVNGREYATNILKWKGD